MCFSCIQFHSNHEARRIVLDLILLSRRLESNLNQPIPHYLTTGLERPLCRSIENSQRGWLDDNQRRFNSWRIPSTSCVNASHYFLAIAVLAGHSLFPPLPKPLALRILVFCVALCLLYRFLLLIFYLQSLIVAYAVLTSIFSGCP